MAQLLSVNVGLPREIEWLGRKVRTAIFKEPVAGRVFAGRLNLAGDGQADLAGHGGEQRAVMVYQAQSYRYWEKFLERSDLRYGQFGENFTVDGLADDEVCVGDRYRIGGAVFEVSQPRVTCYKVGLRLNDPQMPALLVAHRRPGFYFRVIQEGDIGAGDRIEKIAQGPQHLTIAEVDALLYSSNHPAEMLRKALSITALSPGWKSSFEELLQASERGALLGNPGLSAIATARLSWVGFRALRVVAVNQVSEQVRSFELGAPDGSILPSWVAGQHVAVRLPVQSVSSPVVRSYSLCGPQDGGTFRIAVKNEGGVGSRYMNECVRVGDSLATSAPRGTFTLRPGSNPVVLLSAGIGITPLLAMLKALATGERKDSRELWWIHSARCGTQYSFAEESRTLLGTMKLAHRCILYTSPLERDRFGEDYDVRGRLTAAVLQGLSMPADADFYLCGPAAFLTDVQAMLGRLGIEAGRVHLEHFGPVPSLRPGVVAGDHKSPHVPDGLPGSGPAVTFIRSGLTVNWNPRLTSLLELAEACSVPVRWSCRTGVCHNCESGLMDGQVRYSPQPLDPPPAGTILICCAQPDSALELDL